jgi:uncharacterized membrane protein
MQQIKNIGGIGSILLLGGIVPTIGPVLVFAGFVMVVIAVYKLSELVGQKEIFRNYLIGIILSSVMLLIVIFGVGTTIFLSLRAGLAGLGAGIALAILLTWILSIISAYFIKKSFEKIGQVTEVDTFKTAGKLYFFGNILSVILVGLVISLVATIMQIVAFFSLPLTLPGKTQEASPVS